MHFSPVPKKVGSLKTSGKSALHVDGLSERMACSMAELRLAQNVYVRVFVWFLCKLSVKAGRESSSGLGFSFSFSFGICICPVLSFPKTHCWLWVRFAYVHLPFPPRSIRIPSCHPLPDGAHRCSFRPAPTKNAFPVKCKKEMMWCSPALTCNQSWPYRRPFAVAQSQRRRVY